MRFLLRRLYVNMPPPLNGHNIPQLIIIKPLTFNPKKKEWHMHFPARKPYRLRFVCEYPEMPHITHNPAYNLEIPGKFLKAYGVYFKWSLKAMCAVLPIAPNQTVPEGCRDLLQELADILHTHPNNLITIVKNGPNRIYELIQDNFGEIDDADVIAGDPATIDERITNMAAKQLQQLKGSLFQHCIAKPLLIK